MIINNKNIGAFKLIEQLIEKGSKLNHADSCKRTPLHVACLTKNIECVKILLGYPELVNRNKIKEK